MMHAINIAVGLFSRCFEPAGPIVELGSKYLPGWEDLSDLRPLFPERAYVGCDLRSGLGVDRIENAEALTFSDNSVGAVLLCDMLGHTPHPQRVVAETRRVLRHDGVAFVSV